MYDTFKNNLKIKHECRNNCMKSSMLCCNTHLLQIFSKDAFEGYYQNMLFFGHYRYEWVKLAEKISLLSLFITERLTLVMVSNG